MRKIGFVNYAVSLVLSSLCGVGFATGLIFLTEPAPSAKQTLPVISFDNVQLYRNNVESKVNPFDGPMKDAIKAIEKAKMPEVPAVPKVPSMNKGFGETIEVLGVLPPDTCILRKGSETVTVRANEDSSIGSVGQITSDGVYVNGNFYAIK